MDQDQRSFHITWDDVRTAKVRGSLGKSRRKALVLAMIAGAFALAYAVGSFPRAPFVEAKNVIAAKHGSLPLIPRGRGAIPDTVCAVLKRQVGTSALDPGDNLMRDCLKGY